MCAHAMKNDYGYGIWMHMDDFHYFSWLILLENRCVLPLQKNMTQFCHSGQQATRASTGAHLATGHLAAQLGLLF